MGEPSQFQTDSEVFFIGLLIVVGRQIYLVQYGFGSFIMSFFSILIVVTYIGLRHGKFRLYDLIFFLI